MLINNMELIVLIEALKTTKAYQESRAMSCKKEGKEFSLFVNGERDKNDLIFFLAEELMLSLNTMADMRMKQLYELSIVTIQIPSPHNNIAFMNNISMPPL